MLLLCYSCVGAGYSQLASEKQCLSVAAKYHYNKKHAYSCSARARRAPRAVGGPPRAGLRSELWVLPLPRASSAR